MLEPKPADLRRAISVLGPPGEARDRKLDLLEGVRRLLGRTRREVPPWVVLLRDAVQAGEL